MLCWYCGVKYLYLCYLSISVSIYVFNYRFDVSTRIRVLVVVLTSLLSFILVGLALNEPLVLFDVVCASLCEHLGTVW